VKFEWDEAKNLANQKKHGISFQEARSLFETENYVEIFDEEHSETEDRFIAIGPINRGLIVMVWTQSDDETARIISVRFATSNEEGLYERYIGKRYDQNF
jgi:uncharacterized DUF497 family protein